MEPLQGQKDTFLVHYAILDSDTVGRSPADPHFDNSAKSCLHKIAKSNNKVDYIIKLYSSCKLSPTPSARA